jgi:hypothetical protein
VLAPFFDIGAGWNTLTTGGKGASAANPLANDSQGDLLPSAGIGLIFTPTSRVHAELYWGYGFNSKFIQASKTDPQDYGLNFAISVDAF